MKDILARKYFREMEDLESLIQEFGALARVEIIDRVTYKDRSYPLYVLSVGSENPEDPTLGFFGGVHGLERIGSDVVLSYMHTVLELLRWDISFQNRLEKSRLVFMPIVNPVGIVLRSRCNPNGVDLMRNSPLHSEAKGIPLISGQTFSPRLPWFRGFQDRGMEIESQALCKVVEKYLWPSKLSMAIDVHSGFGAKDRFWFPFAYSKKPFPFVAEAYALSELLNQTYPHHVYDLEPVSKQYTISGDLWDYLFLENLKRSEGNFFLPWTLEMGSWNWLRKNPFQIFSPFGMYHPMKPHRRSRTLRRHLPLFDFIHRCCVSPGSWLELPGEKIEIYKRKALDLWYA